MRKVTGKALKIGLVGGAAVGAVLLARSASATPGAAGPKPATGGYIPTGARVPRPGDPDFRGPVQPSGPAGTDHTASDIAAVIAGLGPTAGALASFIGKATADTRTPDEKAAQAKYGDAAVVGNASEFGPFRPSAPPDERSPEVLAQYSVEDLQGARDSGYITLEQQQAALAYQAEANQRNAGFDPTLYGFGTSSEETSTSSGSDIDWSGFSAGGAPDWSSFDPAFVGPPAPSGQSYAANIPTPPPEDFDPLIPRGGEDDSDSGSSLRGITYG